MASLNGAVIGPPASLITLRVACGVGCENAPRTVRIPATAKTAVRKPMRRFMFPLHLNGLRNTPRECNTQFSSRQAPLRHPNPTLLGSLYSPERQASSTTGTVLH